MNMKLHIHYRNLTPKDVNEGKIRRAVLKLFAENDPSLKANVHLVLTGTQDGKMKVTLYRYDTKVTRYVTMNTNDTNDERKVRAKFKEAIKAMI